MEYGGVSLVTGPQAHIEAKRHSTKNLKTSKARVFEGNAPYNYSVFGMKPGFKSTYIVSKPVCREIARIAGFRSCSPEGISIISGLMDLGMTNAIDAVRQMGIFAQERGYRGSSFGHPYHTEAYITFHKGDIAGGQLSQNQTTILSKIKSNRKDLYEYHQGSEAHIIGDTKKKLYSLSFSFVKWALRKLNEGFPKSANNKLSVFYPNQLIEFSKSTAGEKALRTVLYPCENISFILNGCWKYSQKGNSYKFMADKVNDVVDKIFEKVGTTPGVYTRKTSPFVYSVSAHDIILSLVMCSGHNISATLLGYLTKRNDIRSKFTPLTYEEAFPKRYSYARWYFSMIRPDGTASEGNNAEYLRKFSDIYTAIRNGLVEKFGNISTKKTTEFKWQTQKKVQAPYLSRKNEVDEEEIVLDEQPKVAVAAPVRTATPRTATTAKPASSNVKMGNT